MVSRLAARHGFAHFDHRAGGLVAQPHAGRIVERRARGHRHIAAAYTAAADRDAQVMRTQRIVGDIFDGDGLARELALQQTTYEYQPILARAYRQAAGVEIAYGAPAALAGTLGIKTAALLGGWGAVDLYEVSWDQAVVFGGQFVAVTMLSVGFMQIFVDQIHKGQIQAEQGLAREQERSALLLQHSEDLSVLLSEREEIIRQLTLSNKSAGMGALVASIAHELNQPLTTIVLKTELIESHLQRNRDPQAALAEAYEARFNEDLGALADRLKLDKSSPALRAQAEILLRDQQLITAKSLRNLAMRRAQNTKEYLVDTQGIAPERLFVLDSQVREADKEAKVVLTLDD